MQRVLVVRLRSIGDTVLVTPSLFALRRFLPGAQIDILLICHSHNLAELVERTVIRFAIRKTKGRQYVAQESSFRVFKFREH